MRKSRPPGRRVFVLALVTSLMPGSASALCTTDTSAADFAGAMASTCYVASTSDGEVVLQPTEGAEFTGVALPLGWGSFLWTGADGSSGPNTVTVAGGAVTVEGAVVRTDANYGPGRSLEFVATFGNEPFQHVGFGDIADSGSNKTYNGPPWAMFSTGSAGTLIQARVNNGQPGGAVDVDICTTCQDAPHRYRIDWLPGQVDFYIDGALVQSVAQTISVNMRPAISDFNANPSVAALVIDWIRMTPYTSPCTYMSAVVDSITPSTDWQSASLTSFEPAGTDVTVETRSGPTPTPGGSWSSFQPLVATTIQSPRNRYLQYRLQLTSASPGVTPTAEAVEVCFEPCSPTAEVCDGTDNDCDGQVDEGTSGAACTTGQPGICGPGTQQCQSGVLHCVQNVPAQAETCNGVDDDCDGQTDEGDPGGGGACSSGLPGICNAGIRHCQSGALVCVQTNTPVVETCNGLDDNCNGATDEPFVDLGSSCSVGVGACQRTGTKICRGDGTGTTCNVTPGTPAPETCDLQDNDCDGQIDEGNPGGGGACTTGQPGVCSQGTLSCQSGALVCVRDSQPTTEVCNGVDDDCDGSVDEGDPGGGASCNTGLPGACAPGVRHCIDSQIVCQANLSSMPEVCNNADDNCNGQVDEGNPGGGGACSTGALGACDAGALQCQSGALQCVQVVSPSAELCLGGQDEDCDGQTDEIDDCVLCLAANTVTSGVQTKKTKVRLSTAPDRDQVQASGTFVLTTPNSIAPDTEPVSLRVTDAAGVYYQSTVPPGHFLRAGGGRRFSLNDSTLAFGGLRKAKFSLKSDGVTVKFSIKAQGLNEPPFASGTGTTTIQVGPRCFTDDADTCVVSGSSATCR